MSYEESKKQINKIRQEYGCKGEVIFRTAIMTLLDYGRYQFSDEEWYLEQIAEIDERHDKAEAEGKWLFMTRSFEKAIMECTKELAHVHAMDLLVYTQREVWLGNGEVGEPDYQRAMQIVRNCLCYIHDGYGAYGSDCAETLQKFREMDLDDNEIVYFGWEYLFDVEDEEEEY